LVSLVAVLFESLGYRLSLSTLGLLTPGLP
jgi:hypothetical protein